MEQQQNRLTPELVSMAIQTGMLDSSLEALREVIRERRRVIASQSADSLIRGDVFIIKDVSPKKWEGLQVTYLRRENSWLVCLLDESDARRVHKYQLPGPVPQTFREVKLREGHVGPIILRAPRGE